MDLQKFPVGEFFILCPIGCAVQLSSVEKATSANFIAVYAIKGQVIC